VTVAPVTVAGEPARIDRSDERLARRGPAALLPWNDAGVLVAADVHVARRLAALSQRNALSAREAQSRQEDDAVLLGAALAVRALRMGHVCVDVTSIARTATTDVELDIGLDALPWPDPADWLARLVASPLVAAGDSGDPERPLRLVGSRLYLDRYWRQERQVAADLLARAMTTPPVDDAALAVSLRRLWPIEADHDEPEDQRRAGSVAATHGFSVVAGGPGTGKTTTVARILALLADQSTATGGRPPRVALAAPTGRAAARLVEAVHDEARQLDVDETVRSWLLGLGASTIHRLLGRRPDSDSRFRHDHRNRLPHDTVIVDETSMVSLSLMANLLDALRPDTRLILVGDPEQLTSVEAGAVLGDIVGPASVTDRPVGPDHEGQSIGDGIVVLRRVHRYGGGIAALAGAIQSGDDDTVMGLVRAGRTDLSLVDTEADSTGLAEVQDAVVASFTAVTQAAARGDGTAALEHLAAVRVLCGHRQGPAGVGAWTERIEGWLRDGRPRPRYAGPWYVGRPLLISTNDYELQLFNGDTGVVGIGPEGQLAAAFERRGTLEWISPARLPPSETVYATTVHKSQGSQFDGVIFVLPEPGSPLLTRQLLYTAVTRARSHVTLVGSEEAIRQAVGRPIARASGLRERLWGSA
jgi:exodeoxyribonuclease V alpha subunit